MTVCLLETVRIEPAGVFDLTAVRRLWRAYASWLQQDVCLGDLETELALLPGPYAPPDGALLVARAAGDIAGCVGLRRLDSRTCEMKRLWVEPGFGGHSIGRALIGAIIEAAQKEGYQAMSLETLPDLMAAAGHLYRQAGFIARDLEATGVQRMVLEFSSA